MDKITDWNRKRAQQLGVNEDPNRWLWIEHPKHADWIDKATVSDFVDAAEKQGIDPYYFLGMGMVESHLGNLDPDNRARVHMGAHDKALDKLGVFKDQGVNGKSIRQGLIDFAASLMKGHFKKYGKDPVTALQAYSGTGKTIYKGIPDLVEYQYGTTKVFGKPFQQIDFWKEKPQGKATYELANLLKDNEAIRQIVENPKMRFKVNNYLARKEKDIAQVDPAGLKQFKMPLWESLFAKDTFKQETEPDPTGLLQHLWP